MPDIMKATNKQVVRSGDWVEIWKIVLPAGERASQVPPDTAKVPLEMRLRGYLLTKEAEIGQDVVIQTRIGREIEGRLVDLSPSYDHDFGRPQPELLAIGQELREILGRKGEDKA